MMLWQIKGWPESCDASSNLPLDQYCKFLVVVVRKLNFVYEKIILRIKSLINEGLNKFFDAFGIDVGMTKMKAINP